VRWSIPPISPIVFARRTRWSPDRVSVWIDSMSSDWTIARGTLIGSFSNRLMTVSIESACIVEKVVWPVFIA